MEYFFVFQFTFLFLILDLAVFPQMSIASSWWALGNPSVFDVEGMMPSLVAPQHQHIHQGGLARRITHSLIYQRSFLLNIELIIVHSNLDILWIHVYVHSKQKINIELHVCSKQLSDSTSASTHPSRGAGGRITYSLIYQRSFLLNIELIIVHSNEYHWEIVWIHVYVHSKQKMNIELHVCSKQLSGNISWTHSVPVFFDWLNWFTDSASNVLLIYVDHSRKIRRVR